jgi:hypothetical protein
VRRSLSPNIDQEKERARDYLKITRTLKRLVEQSSRLLDEEFDRIFTSDED